MGMFSQLAQGVDWSSLGAMVLRVIAVLLCLVVHEVSHGLAAYRLGDPTAKQSHRLSLNPIHHLDPFGLLMMVVVGFGWAKPVPVDPRYFKNPKAGMALTALAGPLSNFALAFLSLLLARALYPYVPGRPALEGIFLFLLASLPPLSVGLGLFNLIPIPPLDGSKVLAAFLPDRAYFTLMRYERIGILALLAVSLTGVGSGLVSRGIVGVYTGMVTLLFF